MNLTITHRIINKKKIIKNDIIACCSVKKEYASIERDPVYLSYS